jgi:hypothetical protein
MYACVTLPTLEAVKTIAGLYPRWIFRGQHSATQDLQTTLERAAVRNSAAFATTPDRAEFLRRAAFAELPNREDWILYQFRRRAHLVMSAPPASDARLDWLAAIQHYGGPTRLLDFTHSFYVATFFAVEQASEDAAVWGIWAPHLEKTSGIETDRLDKMNMHAVKLVEAVLRGESRATGVLQVEPVQLNERMAIQKGVFVLPLEITKPFMENLTQSFQFDFTDHRDAKYQIDLAQFLAYGLCGGPFVVKFVLPRVEHNRILQDLAAMNIDAGTLFPGLEGYARSMHRFV